MAADKWWFLTIVIGSTGEEDVKGIQKYSRHRASVLYKKELTRLSHSDSQAHIFIPPAKKPNFNFTGQLNERMERYVILFIL